MLLAAEIAEAPSPDVRALAMRDSPFASVAATRARIVCDFDAGIAMLPLSEDFFTSHFMP
jgi:hypothetical protein